MINPLSNSISDLAMQRTMRLNALALSNSLAKLSSGRRINSGSDDPAGLIAVTRLDSTLAELNAQADANQRAMDVLDTADGAMGSISDLLNQAKSLVSANANSDALSDGEKQANQIQLDAILNTVDRLSSSTSFGGQKLLDGSAKVSASGASISISSAATGDIGKVTIDSSDYTLADLRAGHSLNIADSDGTAAAKVLDKAISDIATQRGRIGAFESNDLASNLSTIAVAQEKISASASLIGDTDFAMEVSRKVRSQILLETSTRLLGLPRKEARGLIDLLR